MKKLLLLFFLALLVFSTAAQVNYEIRVTENQMQKNTTALLTCDEDNGNCPVNSWSLQWTIPENSEILRINDTQGVITDYERSGNDLRVQTKEGPSRTAEKIQINTVQKKNAEELASGLYSRDISLSGFPGEKTQGVVHVEDLQSVSISDDFSKHQDNDSVSFEGTGPGNINLNFGEGEETRFYTFFGGKRNSSLAYRVAVGTTGLIQSYNRIPVAVLSDEVYEGRVADWSQGEYSSGVITVRESLKDDFQPVLAEETVHAFNDEALSFDKTSSSWLDEGIAGYTQSMVRKKLVGTEKTRSVFGEETTYIIKENGSRYRISKPSSGNRENLWDYYQENRSFMQDWTPSESSPDVRRFGYAYGELVVRNYVSNNNSLKDFYQQLEPQILESNEEKWGYYSDYLDLTPCKFEDKEKFEACLDEVNAYDYPVYSASNIPKQSSNEIDIQKLETPNYTRKGTGEVTPDFMNQKLFEEGWFSSFIGFLDDLF